MDDTSNLNFAPRNEKIRSHQNLVISTIDHSDMNIISSSCGDQAAKRRRTTYQTFPDEEHSLTLTEDNQSGGDFEEQSNLFPYSEFFIKDRGQVENGRNYFSTAEREKSVYSENRSEIRFNTGRWSAEEHQKFVEAMFLYGNEWKRVQQHIKSRSSTQARSHAQKFFIRLRKKFTEENEEEETNEGQPVLRNERIFNWIKENVNWDTIHKLAKTSGSLLRQNLNSDSNINTTELFLADRKDKLCKIILNLINNSAKSKRKTCSKLSDDCDSQRSMRLAESNNSNISKIPSSFFNSSNNTRLCQHDNNICLPSSCALESSNTNIIPPLNSGNSLTTTNATPLIKPDYLTCSAVDNKVMSEESPVNNSSNYFNPNLNSYISIVTINLGYGKEGQQGTDSGNSVIKAVNKDVNINNGMEKIDLSHECRKANCQEDHLKNYLNRKMNICKLIKNRTLSNNIVSTENFKIVNGLFSASANGEKENDKEKEEKDPFKLTFEENQNNTNNENDFCKLNFDLDLDHFFNN